MKNRNFIVATIKPWNINKFHKISSSLEGNWFLISDKVDLNVDYISEINPSFIFFPHWSWLVPKEIVERWECVCFHMADVPYGRGGSPLQNLIARGHKQTKLSALKMAEELDAGPVYGKTELSLEGSAQDIFERMAPKVYDLIKYIVEHNPRPIEQSGEVTVFKRRTPSQSLLPSVGSIDELYDHIRMLDAESYPRAFINHGGFKLELSSAEIDSHGKLIANVAISINSGD